MTDKHNKKYVVAIDQGTTSSRAIVFDRDANVVSQAQREFAQFYPQAGWVEHDPMEIWATQSSTLVEALAQASIEHDQVAAIGITNQRETTVVWDRHSGRPIHNAIVWQCRRSAAICAQLKRDGLEDYIRETTGLVTDPYFSGTKLKWILDNVPGARQRAERGELRFGTVDCFLLWRLTGGRSHRTDATNASRTLLFNIHSQDWDEELLALFEIPRSLLPEVLDCAAEFGVSEPSLLGAAIPVLGMAGDQQAALIGQ
ncbi:FGGY family carbohydrate kinase, partial [Pseudomonas aeruginosa]|uniref:FGGY family carbohydrate kinase n=1 Tax=Pseudomonas aeruginosa TaxID=287 RepID=UPI000A9D0E00